MNEIAITFPCKRKRKLSAADDPSAATEVWCRKRVKKGYANRTVGIEALANVRKTKCDKKKIEKNRSEQEMRAPERYVCKSNDTTPVQKSKTMPNLSETDSEIQFKPSLITHEPNDLQYLQDDISPLARSTPIVTEMVPNELDDNGIQMAHDLLKACHPNIAG